MRLHVKHSIELITRMSYFVDLDCLQQNWSELCSETPVLQQYEKCCDVCDRNVKVKKYFPDSALDVKVEPNLLCKLSKSDAEKQGTVIENVFIDNETKSHIKKNEERTYIELSSDIRKYMRGNKGPVSTGWLLEINEETVTLSDVTQEDVKKAHFKKFYNVDWVPGR